MSARIDRDRFVAALAAAGVVLAIGYALILGLGVTLPGIAAEALKTFAVGPTPPPPPPDPVRPRPTKSHRPEGAASPANLRSKATPIVAPEPIVPPPVSPPVVAALKPGIGVEATTGAAPVPGPGTGAGGEGNGTGSGRFGDGDGDGGDDTPPRLLNDRFKRRDYPDVETIGAGGVVGVRYRVGVDGRASRCSVTRSSGNPALDAISCRLIETYYRYRPALDPAGHPVPSIIVHDQYWYSEIDPDPPAQPARAPLKGTP